MMTVSNARHICLRTRQYFDQGLGSGNKIDPDPRLRARADTAHHQILNVVRPATFSAVSTGEQNWLTVDFLLKKAKHDKGARAGNCKEMAAVAAYVVFRLGEKRGLPYVGIVGEGVHGFCLVSPTDLTDELVFENMGAVRRALPECIIIDPWLDVTGLAADFNAAAYDTLVRWERFDRKIRGGDGLGDPTGPFLSDLATQEVKLTRFQPPPESRGPEDTSDKGWEDFILSQPWRLE